MPKSKQSDFSLVFDLWQTLCENIISCSNSILSVEEDEECVHQYRVAIRKARSFLLFLKPLLKVAFFDTVNGQLKMSANHFSKAREWDVLIVYYQEEYLRQVDEDPKLTEFLVNEQMRYRRMAYAEFDSNIIASVINTFKTDFKEIGFKGKALKCSWDAFVKKRTKKLKRNIACLEKDLKPVDLKNVHAYRIANKRLRYVLELLNPSVHGVFDKQIKRLKAKTNQLGSRCDLFVMQGDLRQLDVQNTDQTGLLNNFLVFISTEMTKSEANL